MRVLVCGSRSWEDVHAIRMRLLRLPAATEIIHGGAPGADTIAGWLAEDFGFSVTRVDANWELHGKGAGRLRNLCMLDMGPALVLAFWDGKSPGTAHTIREARKRGIPVEVVPDAETAPANGGS